MDIELCTCSVLAVRNLSSRLAWAEQGGLGNHVRESAERHSEIHVNSKSRRIVLRERKPQDNN